MVITSPNVIPVDVRPHVFLAGSIDMGGARDWQKEVIEGLSHDDVVVLNPRRSDWNPAWKPELDEPNFKEQVDWELSALEQSDVIAMVLTADSKSPISLLELGLYAKTGRLIVLCEPGYWREGNVDAVAKRYKIITVTTIPALIDEIHRAAKAARPHR